VEIPEPRNDFAGVRVFEVEDNSKNRGYELAVEGLRSPQIVVVIGAVEEAMDDEHEQVRGADQPLKLQRLVFEVLELWMKACAPAEGIGYKRNAIPVKKLLCMGFEGWNALFAKEIGHVVMCTAWPQAESQPKPGQKRPGQARPRTWLALAFGLASYLESRRPGLKPRLYVAIFGQ
jgi:hypothetical protein